MQRLFRTFSTKHGDFPRFKGIDLDKIFSQKGDIKSKILAEVRLAESDIGKLGEMVKTRDGSIQLYKEKSENLSAQLREMTTKFYFAARTLNLRAMIEQLETKMRIVYREQGILTRGNLWRIILKDEASQMAFRAVGLTDPDLISNLAVKIYSQLSADIHQYPHETELVIDNATGKFGPDEVKFLLGLANLINVNIKFSPSDHMEGFQIHL